MASKIMKNKIITIIILIAIILLVLAVREFLLEARIRKHYSNTITQDALESPIYLKGIELKNINILKEVASLKSNELEMALQISESPKPEILQVVFQSGNFVQWDVSTQEIKSTQAIFKYSTNKPVYTNLHTTNAVISFNNNGSLFTSPVNIVSDHLQGKIIWDSNLESLVYTENTKYDSLLIHPTLNIIFMIYEKSNDISYLYWFGDKNFGGGGFSIGDRFSLSELTRMAVDPTGNYLVTVDINGHVILGDISTFKLPNREGFFEHASPYEVFGYTGNPITTIDLEFDNQGSWLGWLTDKKIVVWNLKEYLFPLVFEKHLDNGNAICFDRTGNILAVATQTGIRIFSTESGEEIANYPVGDVTAIYFSRDNRLLIWGDGAGNIHIWGVK